ANKMCIFLTVKNVIIIILFLAVLSLAGEFKKSREDFYTESAVFETDSGSFTLTFFKKSAPEHVKNFKDLVSSGYYEDKSFHRIVPGFIIQAGRDEDTPYSSIDPEIEKIHFKGALAAARMSNDINPAKRSDSYEFYISLKPQPELDGEYTVFGRVAEGFETVKKISESATDENDEPVNDILIKHTYLQKFFDREKYDYYIRRSEQN
ncbi:MAG: peptidylprolyl isomerase, partial [Candidatus Delongbacteria bacterium]